MLLSHFCQLPLVLLLSCLGEASTLPQQRSLKTEPDYNVLDGSNFPDPSILKVDGISYVFGTVDGAGHNIPMVSNRHYDHASGWSAITDAFPVTAVPAFGSDGWAEPLTSWAPDVQQLVSDFNLAVRRLVSR